MIAFPWVPTILLYTCTVCLCHVHVCVVYVVKEVASLQELVNIRSILKNFRNIFYVHVHVHVEVEKLY